MDTVRDIRSRVSTLTCRYLDPSRAYQADVKGSLKRPSDATYIVVYERKRRERKKGERRREQNQINAPCGRPLTRAPNKRAPVEISSGASSLAAATAEGTGSIIERNRKRKKNAPKTESGDLPHAV